MLARAPGGRPPGLTLPHGQRDEWDDASGHRIYLNPWAAGDEGEEIPVGLIEEYFDEP